MPDLVIRGGTVLDGTGTPGRTADVAVSDGRIAEVGRITGQAARELDAAGAIVCPGFIDLHSHADFSVFDAPQAVTQATQGVTTLVTGNCGFSTFPIATGHKADLLSNRLSNGGGSWDWTTAKEFADEVDRLPIGVNLALQVGHAAVRIAVMGLEDRKPTDEELDRMRGYVRQAVADGVVGFSTGLIYVPGRFADTDEIVALAREAAAGGLLYSTHMRDKHSRLLESVHEALTIARQAGVRLEISHLKAAGPETWGTVGVAIDAIETARENGVDVAADQYPYTASSTTLTASLPAWAMDGGVPALLARLETPSGAARLAKELNDRTGRSFWPERIVIADLADGPFDGYVGQNLSSLASALGLDTGTAIVELLRGQEGHVGIVHHGMSEDDVRQVMRQEFVSVASDGWVLHCPGAGKPHPRSFGTFTRILARYVREERVLRLPEAIRKMTSHPAARLGWTDRGVVAPGAIADLTVFDSSRVQDNSTFDQPWQLSTGVLHTLLAGTPVFEDGAPTGTAAGRVIRHRPGSPSASSFARGVRTGE